MAREKVIINSTKLGDGYFKRIRLYPITPTDKKIKLIEIPKEGGKQRDPRKIDPGKYNSAHGERATFYQLIEKYCVATAIKQFGEYNPKDSSSLNDEMNKLGRKFKVSLEEIIVMEREEVLGKISVMGREEAARYYGVSLNLLEKVY